MEDPQATTKTSTVAISATLHTTGAPGSVAHAGGPFEMPPAPGTYVYGITGTWPEGDVTFFLPLEVIPGCA